MDLNFNFDEEIDRTGTCASKYENRKLYFGTDELLPLSVADMEFAAPPQVTDALRKRAEHPIYGYSVYPESLYQTFMAWMEKRHNWKIEREWIVLSPGVVPALFAAVQAYTQKGESVIIQPPVYPPFFQAVTENDRQVLENPLHLISDDKHNQYVIDYVHLERCAAQAKLMLFCSPQNPTGRVFARKELERLLAIAKRRDLIIFSDEIHADLVDPYHKHAPLGIFNQELVISAFAPSKTFNIPGLNLAALIIPNPHHRATLQKVFASLHVGEANPFSVTAFEAAYCYGEEWLTQLVLYIKQNKRLVEQFLQNEIPLIKLVQSEGTFLLWLDCRQLKMDDAQLKQFFVQQARCGLLPGVSFGKAGSGFMRMNIAAPRRKIEQALFLIQVALKEARLLT